MGQRYPLEKPEIGGPKLNWWKVLEVDGAPQQGGVGRSKKRSGPGLDQARAIREPQQGPVPHVR